MANPIVDVKECKVAKGEMGQYHVWGGELDDAIFTLKTFPPTDWEFHKRVLIKYPKLPDIELMVDICNPMWSLSFEPCLN